MEEGVVLKAYNGVRKKNLEALAVEFRKLLDSDAVTLSGIELRRFNGYCDQLEIIADEIHVPVFSDA